MRIIIIHIGVLIALLALIMGLWQQYDYTTLIFKTVIVFFVWTFSTSIIQYIIKAIIPPPKEEPENAEESDDAAVNEIKKHIEQVEAQKVE